MSGSVEREIMPRLEALERVVAALKAKVAQLEKKAQKQEGGDAKET